MTERSVAPVGAVVAAVVSLGVLGATASTALAADSGTCPPPAAYGGSGTVGDPIRIGAPGQLQQLRDTSADWGKVVRLTGDIDMGGTCTWGTTFGPSPTSFDGTFDGGGHTVEGLDIDLSGGSAFAGFIGYLGMGGVVRDLGFTGDVTATASAVDDVMGTSATAYAGGLVGFTQVSTIERSWASGHVTVSVSAVDHGGGNQPEATAMAYAGGLVGMSQGTVADVFTTATVTASATASVAGGSDPASAAVLAGGIAGTLDIGALSNAYSTAVPVTTATATGGASPTTSVRSGGLVGSHMFGSVTASLWDVGAWPGTGSGTGGAVGTGVSRSALTSFATFGPGGADWDITDGYSPVTTWGICAGANGGLPFLTSFEAASPCAPPPPDSTPTPAPVPAVQEVGGASAGGAGGDAVAAPRVHLRGGAEIPLGRTSILATVAGAPASPIPMAAWCELRGARVPRGLQARLCGLRIVGAASAEQAGQRVRVVARPTCTVGLRLHVRVAGRRGAWGVSAASPTTCRLTRRTPVTG